MHAVTFKVLERWLDKRPEPRTVTFTQPSGAHGILGILVSFFCSTLELDRELKFTVSLQLPLNNVL